MQYFNDWISLVMMQILRRKVWDLWGFAVLTLKKPYPKPFQSKTTHFCHINKSCLCWISPILWVSSTAFHQCGGNRRVRDWTLVWTIDQGCLILAQYVWSTWMTPGWSKNMRTSAYLCMMSGWYGGNQIDFMILWVDFIPSAGSVKISEKSDPQSESGDSRTHVSAKPEYRSLVGISIATFLLFTGSVGIRSHSIFDGHKNPLKCGEIYHPWIPRI